MTPTEVWEGFNPVKEPLETSIISSEEIENTVYSKVFFTSETTVKGRVRVFSTIVYDKRWTDDRAALLIIPSVNDDTDYGTFIKSLVAEGYVVCLFDYCGSFNHNTDHTVFPSDLGYASYPECMSKIGKIETDARHTPWFQWAKIARRTISLLEEHRLVANDRIGVVGVGMGAQIAWQVAGIDGRVRALVPINGGGYLWRAGKPRFSAETPPVTDEERAFSTGVGAETYARFVTCPTCFVTTSNSTYCDVDRAGDIFSLINTEDKRLIISNNTDEQLTKRCFKALLLWLRNNFALDGQPAQAPSLGFEQIEQQLYLRLISSEDAEIKSVYICYGEPYTAARYWIKLNDPQKTARSEYTYAVPVYDVDELIVAYATVGGRDGSIMSTPVTAAVPSKLGINGSTANTYAFSRIIYDGSMGLGSFAAITRDVFLDETVLCQAEGPFGIKGIMTKDGDLSLCRSNHDTQALTRSAVFRFDAYSPTARIINIKMLSYPEMKYYTASVRLEGGEFWQKVMLTSADFKSEEGKTLQKFSDAKKCVFAEAKNVIFNNLLWI